MSATLPDVIDEDLLFCGLCFRFYNDEPKILPCLHIFCKMCLVQHVEKLEKVAANKPPLPKKPTHLAGNVKGELPKLPKPSTVSESMDKNAKETNDDGMKVSHSRSLPKLPSTKSASSIEKTVASGIKDVKNTPTHPFDIQEDYDDADTDDHYEEIPQHHHHGHNHQQHKQTHHQQHQHRHHPEPLDMSVIHPAFERRVSGMYEDYDSMPTDDDPLSLDIPKEQAPLPPLSPHPYLTMHGIKNSEERENDDEEKESHHQPPPVPAPRTKKPHPLPKESPKEQPKEPDEGYEVPVNNYSPPTKPPSRPPSQSPTRQHAKPPSQPPSLPPSLPPSRPVSTRRNTVYVYEETEAPMLKHSKSDFDLLGHSADQKSRSMSMDELNGVDLDMLVPVPSYDLECDDTPAPTPLPRKRLPKKAPISPNAALPPRMVPLKPGSKHTHASAHASCLKSIDDDSRFNASCSKPSSAGAIPKASCSKSSSDPIQNACCSTSNSDDTCSASCSNTCNNNDNNDDDENRFGNVYTLTPTLKNPKEKPPPPKDTPKEEEKKFACPTCAKQHVLPPTGVSEFRTCSFVTNLLETVNAQSVSPRTCDNCEAKEADFKCLECSHYLCSGCKKAHHWLKITKNHRVMTLKQLQSGKYQTEMLQKSTQTPCEYHPSLPAHFFCAQCNKAICEDCRNSEQHFLHSCATIEATATRDRQFLDTLLETLDQQETAFKENEKSVKEYEEKCQEEKKKLLEAIQKQKETIVQVLEEVSMELQRQVTSQFQTEMSRISTITKNNNLATAIIAHAARLTDQLRQHGSPGHLVSMTTCLKQSINGWQGSGGGDGDGGGAGGAGGSDVKPEMIEEEMQLQYHPPEVNEDDLLSVLGRCVRRQIRSKSPEPRSMRNAFHEEKSRHTKETPALLHEFRTKTDRDNKGCKPTGIAITKDDHLVVVDDINKKLKIFHENGTLIKELCPTGEGALIDPWDVTITKYGNFAVTDKMAGVVKIFDPDGDLVSSFGDHLKQPWGIATNSLGDMIVTDPVCHEVFIHDTAGCLKFSLGKTTGTQHDQFFSCPEYVAVNQNDDIIVSDFQKHSVTIFDSIGRFLQRVGLKGRGCHEFNVPCGVTCDVLNGGMIYVADYNNQRVTQLDLNGRFLCFHLTMVDHLYWPQALGIDSKGRLIVIDGSNIKIFGQKGDRIEMNVEIPAEPKPKVHSTHSTPTPELKSAAVNLRREAAVEKRSQSPFLEKKLTEDNESTKPKADKVLKPKADQKDDHHHEEEPKPPPVVNPPKASVKPIETMNPLQNMIETMTLIPPAPRSKSEGFLKGKAEPVEAYDVPKPPRETYDIPTSRFSYDVPVPSSFNYSNTKYGVYHEDASKYETLDSSGSFDSVTHSQSMDVLSGGKEDQTKETSRQRGLSEGNLGGSSKSIASGSSLGEGSIVGSIAGSIAGNVTDDKLGLPTIGKEKKGAKSKKEKDKNMDTSFEREKPARKSLSAFTRRLSKSGKKKKVKEMEKKEQEEAAAAEEENRCNMSLEEKQQGQDKRETEI